MPIDRAYDFVILPCCYQVEGIARLQEKLLVLSLQSFITDAQSIFEKVLCFEILRRYAMAYDILCFIEFRRSVSEVQKLNASDLHVLRYLIGCSVLRDGLRLSFFRPDSLLDLFQQISKRR